METSTWFDMVGWAGVVCYVAGYLLLTLGYLKPHQYAFHFFNILGAIGLITNSAHHHDTPSVVVNAVWLAIGLFAICRRRFVISQKFS